MGNKTKRRANKAKRRANIISSGIERVVEFVWDHFSGAYKAIRTKNPSNEIGVDAISSRGEDSVLSLKFMSKIICFFLLIVSTSGCGLVSGGDCGSYTDWKLDRTACEPNFWRIFKGQQATYKYYSTSKQCKDAVVRDTKRTKENCGC